MVERRYSALRFMVGFNNVIVVGVGVIAWIVAMDQTKNPLALFAVTGVFVVIGVATIALGQLFKVLVDIEENTRIIIENTKGREAPHGTME